MSRSIYSAFEFVNQKTGEWEIANLYEKYGSDYPEPYGIAQLIRGNSQLSSVLFGEEPLDFPIDDDGVVIDNLVDPLERIDNIITELSGSIPINASQESKKLYEKHCPSPLGDDNGMKYYPPCVTYTLRDLDLIELLAKSATAKATRNFNRYFAQIRWLLYTVMSMEYVSKSADVRTIIWSY